MTDYYHIKPRTVSTLKFRKVEEPNQMNTPRTLEITIPDNYTADELREHLARLPVKVKEPWRVASEAYFSVLPMSLGVYTTSIENISAWTHVAEVCREGYVEKDKIEAALAERFGMTSDGSAYEEGYLAGHSRLSQLIREAIK